MDCVDKDKLVQSVASAGRLFAYLQETTAALCTKDDYVAVMAEARALVNMADGAPIGYCVEDMLDYIEKQTVPYLRELIPKASAMAAAIREEEARKPLVFQLNGAPLVRGKLHVCDMRVEAAAQAVTATDPDRRVVAIIGPDAPDVAVDLQTVVVLRARAASWSEQSAAALFAGILVDIVITDMEIPKELEAALVQYPTAVIQCKQ